MKWSDLVKEISDLDYYLIRDIFGGIDADFEDASYIYINGYCLAKGIVVTTESPDKVKEMLEALDTLQRQ